MTPSPCEEDCIMILAENPCEKCIAHYQYWAEVDDSEMDIDWHEYDAVIKEHIEQERPN